jgi:hypothetical protein
MAAWLLVLDLAAHVGAGILIGRLTLRWLWSTIRQMGDGGFGPKTVARMIGRFALLAILLTLASLEGAAQLLALAAGVLAARRHLGAAIWQRA